LIIAPFSLWALNKANKVEDSNESKSEQT